MMTQQERIAAAIAAFRTPEAKAAREAARKAEAEAEANRPAMLAKINREHRERIVLARRALGWQGRREQEARINAALLAEAEAAGARW